MGVRVLVLELCVLDECMLELCVRVDQRVLHFSMKSDVSL